MTKKPCALITGAGTLATALAFRLVEDGYKVRTLSRSEMGREKLRATIGRRKLYVDNISIQAGDVCDGERLRLALSGVDTVIHAAALKRIDLCEYDPIEAIRVNVEGTKTVLGACIKSGVSKALLISSDKATSPSTLYGATKLCAERMWLAAATAYTAKSTPFFFALRYGNVFGSAGSVIHAFREQAKIGQLTITDADATRFHITLDQAVNLVMYSLKFGRPGELYVPRLPSYALWDLADAFMAENSSVKWKAPEVIGLRPSEKRHEQMISLDESESVTESNDYRYVLDPAKSTGAARWCYTSDQNGQRLSVDELRKLIQESAA